MLDAASQLHWLPILGLGSPGDSTGMHSECLQATAAVLAAAALTVAAALTSAAALDLAAAFASAAALASAA